MRMLQSILLATDLQQASEEVTNAAVRIARAFGSSVTLLHVLEPMPAWPIALYQEREQMSAPLAELAKRLQTEKVPVASLVCVGPPALTIVRKAQEINADLIVMGAGMQSKFEQFRAGPVAEAVLQHAIQPVLAIRPGAPQAYFQRILCPVDQSLTSARGLDNAIRLARAFESRLHVVSIVPEKTWLASVVETKTTTNPRAEHARLWREEFEHFIEDVDFDSVRWTKELRNGDPCEEIVAAASEQQSDVIVMGSTGRSGLARMLMGSVTRRLLQTLPCALLAVKDEDMMDQVFEDDVRQARLLMAEGAELLKNGCYLAALVKFRQVSAINPFHVGAIEGQAKAHEGLGQLDEAAVYHCRAERLRHCDEAVV